MNRFVVDYADLKITGKKKQTNGGPGSGNFGHAGRPGKVGGSSSDSFSHAMRKTKFMVGDTVEVTLDDGSKKQGEFKFSARLGNGQKMLTVKGEDGEIYVVPFTRQRVKMIKNVDEPDTKPSERRTEKQKQALGEVFDTLTVSESMKKYMLNNCGEDTAIGLRDEIKKAQADGVDFTGVELVRLSGGSRNRADMKTTLRGEYDGIRYNYKEHVQLRVSASLVAGGANYEAQLKKEFDSGEKNTDTIASVFRHEFGHLRTNNLVSKLTGGNYTGYDYDRLNRLITDKALKKVGKSFGDVPELVSEYGSENRAEMLAESFARPEKSALTKAVVEAYKEFKQEDWGAIRNELKFEREFLLCTGIPIVEEPLEEIEEK